MKLISFKVSDEVAEYVESLVSNEEPSISLVAKRIFLEAIDRAERKTTVDERLEAIENQLLEIKKFYPC